MINIITFIDDSFRLLFIIFFYYNIFLYILSFYLSLTRWHVIYSSKSRKQLIKCHATAEPRQSLSLCICILYSTDRVSRNFDLRDWSREDVNWTVSDITYWSHTLCNVCRYTYDGAHTIFRTIEAMQAKIDPIRTVCIHI